MKAQGSTHCKKNGRIFMKAHINGLEIQIQRGRDWHRVNRKPIKTKATPINTISTKKEEGEICTRYRKISFEYGRTNGQTDGRTSIWSIQTFIGIIQSAIILQDIMACVSEAIKSILKILFFLPRYGGY